MAEFPSPWSYTNDQGVMIYVWYDMDGGEHHNAAGYIKDEDVVDG